MVGFYQYFPAVSVAFSTPNTKAKSLFSICAYRASVGVRVLNAYAIGCPFCRRQAPRPLWDASHWRTVGRSGLKNFNTVACVSVFSISLKHLPWTCSSQKYSVSFFINSRSGVVNSANYMYRSLPFLVLLERLVYQRDLSFHVWPLSCLD